MGGRTIIKLLTARAHLPRYGLDKAKIENEANAGMEELQTATQALRRRGYKGKLQKISMTRWRNSTNSLINMALPHSWFDEIGLINLGTYKTGTLSFYYER